MPREALKLYFWPMKIPRKIKKFFFFDSWICVLNLCLESVSWIRVLNLCLEFSRLWNLWKLHKNIFLGVFNGQKCSFNASQDIFPSQKNFFPENWICVLNLCLWIYVLNLCFESVSLNLCRWIYSWIRVIVPVSVRVPPEADEGPGGGEGITNLLRSLEAVGG